MTDQGLPRKLIVLGVLAPLAVLVGYLMATPDDSFAVVAVAMVVGFLSLPVVLRWHHAILIFSLNAALIVAFLPGSPNVWMLMTAASGGLTLLGRILDKNRRLVVVPSVTWPLVALGAVVLMTAKVTGGFGLRSLGGGTYGGKKYFYVWGAILAYFALSWVRVPLTRAAVSVYGYLLSGLTSVLSNLVYIAGPAAWVFYSFIPVDMALHQIFEDYAGGPGGERFTRLGGVAAAAQSLVPFLMLRFGIRGLLDFGRPWRLAALVAVVFLGALGGFRSNLVFIGLLFAVQFALEGLVRTRLFPALVLTGVLGFAALFPLARHLPMSVQRSLSIVPLLPVSPAARWDAEQSSLWRLEMWSMVTPDIPRYFWLGKGFTASATDYYFTQELVRRGKLSDQELMILAGDYHNGPLSLLIPFGIWGVLAFIWFAAASIRLLYRNYCYGDPRIRLINTFLFAYFLAKLVYFLGVFGAIHLDLLTFVGIVGLSVCLNGGLRRPDDVAAAAPAS